MVSILKNVVIIYKKCCVCDRKFELQNLLSIETKVFDMITSKLQIFLPIIYLHNLMHEQIKAFFPLIMKKRHVTYGTFPGTFL